MKLGALSVSVPLTLVCCALSSACVAEVDDDRALADSAAEADVGQTQSAVSASVCGSGYKLIKVLPLEAYAGFPLPGGELEVFYNASTGMNCLIEQSLGAQYGKNKRMFVRVCTEPLGWTNCLDKEHFDGGDYKYYAGPVYVKAPHQCIYYVAAIYEGPTANHGGGAYAIDGKGFCN